MGWHYAALHDEDDDLWFVCEVYPNLGTTGPMRPMGETKEVLVKELRRMLADVTHFPEEVTHGEEE